MDPKSNVASASPGLSWLLVYTKPRAESWTDINLRNQGFVTLLPRVASRGRFVPLFPRYVFVGYEADDRTDPIGNTLGVLYVVQCGPRPARVPLEVIDEIRARMSVSGVVQLDQVAVDPLFAKQQRDRIRTLLKLTQAGFRVKSA